MRRPTASSYILTNEDVKSTVRLVVTASNAAGATAATSTKTPEIAGKPTGPLAIVYNQGGQPIVQYGSAYGSRPGTQIQLAENYAKCGNAEGCLEGSHAIYPTVKLEPGTYHVQTVHGAGPWLECYGILAFSDVALEGSTTAPGSIVENEAPYESAACPEGSVIAVVGVNKHKVGIPCTVPVGAERIP